MPTIHDEKSSAIIAAQNVADDERVDSKTRIEFLREIIEEVEIMIEELDSKWFVL